MARNNFSCDLCGKPTERIVAKLYLSNRTGQKNDHANYTAHADVGICCIEKVVKNGIKWQTRKRNKRTKEKVGHA